jgi:glucose/arabinose dehydrogenase
VITFIVIFAVLVIFLSIVLCIGNGMYSTNAEENKLPIVVENNKNFVIELVFKGLNSSNMAFLGPTDILVLGGNNGKVYRILNGQMLEEPIIDLNSFHQDGLIGIATVKNQNGPPYVFLYLNEAPAKYGNDVNNKKEARTVNRILGYDQEGDRLYRYKLVGNKLVEPKLLFEIKAPRSSNILGVMHHGGEVLIGPDSAVYVGTGDLEGSKYGFKTKAQNYKDSNDEPDGRSGILRVTQDGKPVGKGILGNTYPLNLYYAYGIRNSFGMDIDPVTGNMWITENGPNYGDEINLAEPGFNSGADILYGMSTEYDKLQNLVNFEGKGKYSEPEFVWTHTVCPTALKFFNSDKFGKEYENDMFVADFNKGNIYHFDLNEKRTELILLGPLQDKVADKSAELKDIIFAKGFGRVTDLQVGPDGYLYVLSSGKIFRIIPKN